MPIRLPMNSAQLNSYNLRLLRTEPAAKAGTTASNFSSAPALPSFSELFEQLGGMDWMGEMVDASGWEEAQRLRQEYLDRALAELQGLKSDPLNSILRTGIEKLASPNSELVQAQGARVRTGLREQMRALGQNAAAAGIPRSQDAMTEAMQAATDRLASLPSINLAQALSLAPGALTALQRPSMAMSEVLSNVQVQDLSSALLSAMQGLGSVMGNYFPELYHTRYPFEQYGYAGGIF